EPRPSPRSRCFRDTFRRIPKRHSRVRDTTNMMEHRAMMNPIAMRMIFALMDSDGDGTISLEEWQAAHGKIFKAMDADKDGTVSFEEMMNFFRGTARSAPHQ